MLRRIFGPERKTEVTGGWKKFHYEQFHDFHSSPNIIRGSSQEYEMGGACSTHGRAKK
jgi:hypothetical protein